MRDNHNSASPEVFDGRLLQPDALLRVCRAIRKLVPDDSRLLVELETEWYGDLSWARNKVTLAADRRRLKIYLRRFSPDGLVSVFSNQVDEQSLKELARASGENIFPSDMKRGGYNGLVFDPPLLPYPRTLIWSDATFDLLAEKRGEIARELIRLAAQEQLSSAGFLQVRACEAYAEDNAGSMFQVEDRRGFVDKTPVGDGGNRQARDTGYERHSEAECSLTVRHPQGKGSGWAGLSSYDWTKIDAQGLARRAMDLCLRSINPVAIEPGRYTVILMPQAVAELVGGRTRPERGDYSNGAREGGLTRWLQNRFFQENPEQGGGPFTLGADQALGLVRTKLGLKVIDDRISIRHDPMHADLGIVPQLGLTPVTWIEHGVLRALGHSRGETSNIDGVANRQNSKGWLLDDVPVLSRYAFEMTGGTDTVEEMIATSKRAVLVNRFSKVSEGAGRDKRSVLMSGFTRDGLWLVENGKITKAVKNMRWVDSPLFVLNQVVALGVPVPVYRPGDSMLRPAIVPPVKANDFAFTATIDAV